PGDAAARDHHAARADRAHAPGRAPRGGRAGGGGGGAGLAHHPRAEGAPAVTGGRLPGGGSSSGGIGAERRGLFGVRGSGDTSGYGRLVRRVPEPPAAQRPFGGWFDEAADALAASLGSLGVGFEDAIEAVTTEFGELTLYVR